MPHDDQEPDQFANRSFSPQRYANLKPLTARQKKLCEDNYKLVYSVARRMAQSEQEFDEMVSEGWHGLFIAAQRFKPHLGYQFSTYACTLIWSKIMQAVRISDRFGPSTIHSVPSEVGSLRMRFDMSDCGSVDGGCAGVEDRDLLMVLLGYVTRRERSILIMRYGFDMTLDELAEQSKVTKERIRQICNAAFAKIRSRIGSAA